MVGDGMCNDETNNQECYYDGGDCCGSCIITDFCVNCTCIGVGSNNPEVMNPLIGDGICHDEFNTETCNFDGGDCTDCGQCEAITITLKNNTLLAQGLMEGLHFNSSLVNGKPSWTSTVRGSTLDVYAVWFVKGQAELPSFWMIGYASQIGQNFGGMFSESGSQCPFDIPSEQWYYYSDANGWTMGEQNEIKLECLTGKSSLSVYHHLYTALLKSKKPRKKYYLL